jgi:hypothetical protein
LSTPITVAVSLTARVRQHKLPPPVKSRLNGVKSIYAWFPNSQWRLPDNLRYAVEKPAVVMKLSPFAKKRVLIAFFLGAAAVSNAQAAVVVERLPEGGMQPVAVTDDRGTVHLVWLRGDPGAADVFYWRLPGGRTNESKPIRVNTHDGSAVALGTVRGARLAIGRTGHVYVVWNGSSKAEPKHDEGSPLIFTKLNDRGDAFEPERDLGGDTRALDGGAAVAADQKGNVYVVWHSMPKPGGVEKNRQVYLTQSADDGKTFSALRPVSLVDGVCGCCGLQAFTDKQGDLHIVYRSVSDPKQRDITGLVSRDHGKTFTAQFTDPWQAGGCPMSTAAYVNTPRGILGAWETKGQIEGAWLDANAASSVSIAPISTTSGSKHPSLASNSRGDVLAAWAVGTGWMRGGSVAWQTLDPAGKPNGAPGSAPGLPAWDFPAAFARNDGNFVVMY